MKMNFAAYGIRVRVYSRVIECFHCTRPESGAIHIEDLYTVSLYMTTANEKDEDRLGEVTGRPATAVDAFEGYAKAVRIMG